MEQFLDYALTGIVFFLIFSVIILIHEGGHFWAARLGGIGIEEFGFGLPPRAWGKKNKKSKILYSINWIPFGGFVRMEGEDNSKKRSKTAFNNRPLWARIFAVCAGVIMNFFLGWLLLFIGFLVGMNPILITPADYTKAEDAGILTLDRTGAFVTGIVKGSPADRAGLLPKDFIVAIDQNEIHSQEELIRLKEKGMHGDGFHVSYIRKDFSENPKGQIVKEEYKVITPDENGNIGLYLSEIPPIISMKKQKLPIVLAATEAGKEVYRLSIFTVKMLGDVVKNIVSKFAVPDGVGGPVAIATMTYQFVQMGDVIELLKFAALLSISIAVINIMPFPALDGGRLLFLLIEGIIRRPVSQKYEGIIHGVGFIFLIGLLILVTWNDIMRLITG